MVAFSHRAAVTDRRSDTLLVADATMATAIATAVPHQGSREARHGLTHIIDAQVVPRLVLNHGPAAIRPEQGLPGGPQQGAEEVLALSRLLVVDDHVGALAHVEGLRAAGASLDALFLDLLAPAARHLGALWEEDLCDFGAVTLGLMRLQHMMRSYAPAFEAARRERNPRRRVLLTTPPDEQHSFGRDMLARFFRRAAWDVWDGQPRTTAELQALVRREWFAVIGISAASDARVEVIAGSIRAVRRASRNREIGIMVGGPLFAAKPELVAQVGADATASDGRQATLQAERLLALLAHRD